MGYIGGNTFRFMRRHQTWRGNGSREIEPQPEQSEHSAANVLWLEENNKPKPRPTARLDHCLRQISMKP
jgi:hypothetical protein